MKRIYGEPGKCPETSTDVALKPAHLPPMLNIRDPFSENVAKAAHHSDRQLYIEEPAQSAGPRDRFCGKPAQDG